MQLQTISNLSTKLRFRICFYATVLFLLAVSMVYFGRVVFCDCAEFRLWISDVWSKHNSQHLFDPYSFSHLLHGVIFFWLLSRLGLNRNLCLLAGFTIEALWEFVENSPIIIDRYRQVTMSQGYSGDSIVNSLGDLFSCLIGLELARVIGFRASLCLFVIIEISMLLIVRDCLILNIIMLLYPLESIRSWQMAG